jgi:hypothetical protein
MTNSRNGIWPSQYQSHIATPLQVVAMEFGRHNIKAVGSYHCQHLDFFSEFFETLKYHF